MKLPVLKSPFAGMPDGRVQMPTKPVRLTLQPEEALVLHVALETLQEALQKATHTDRTEEILELLGEVHGKLLDRLEVSFNA